MLTGELWVLKNIIGDAEMALTGMRCDKLDILEEL
jgi:hypothetical protein